jgi:hypothetical protein
VAEKLMPRASQLWSTAVTQLEFKFNSCSTVTFKSTQAVNDEVLPAKHANNENNERSSSFLSSLSDSADDVIADGSVWRRGVVT